MIAAEVGAAEQPRAGALLVCATPIGNLEDVTLRVLAALRGADVVACEDTRHTRRLLSRHGVEPARVVSLHEHNERPRARELVARIAGGARVALVSDAGTPVISDPGFLLVRLAIEAGVPVEVLPGPSAVVSALVVSGLPAERWTFVGFLPRKRASLVALFDEVQETFVAFESPRRVAASLGALAEVDGERLVAVCRELTKVHEQVLRGSAIELAEALRAQGGSVRGEVVVVVGPSRARVRERAREKAVSALRELVAAGARPRPAAAALATLTGVSANELYRALTSARAQRTSGGEQ